MVVSNPDFFGTLYYHYHWGRLDVHKQLETIIIYFLGTHKL